MRCAGRVEKAVEIDLDKPTECSFTEKRLVLFLFFGTFTHSFARRPIYVYLPKQNGWPENTDPRSMDPRYGPPQKIAEKENKQKYKQKWLKDLTYHLNGLSY